MKESIHELDKNIVVEKIKFNDNKYYVNAHLKNKYVVCPFCGNRVKSIHSTHTRKIQDIPVQNHTVFINITVRQFNCRNCKKIFTEQLSFAEPTAHKTNRLNELILNNSCSASSITAQKQLNGQGIIVKKSTICTLQKKRYS